MKTLVLGGSVFVGKHTVEALLAGGHEVAVLNRGRTPTDLPDEVERVVADRTDIAQLRSVLGGRDWDAVFDVSGFVMAAGGSDIAGLLDLLDGRVGHYVFVSSIMAYDQAMSGVFPWTENLPSNPDGPGSYGGFKALAEAEMLIRHQSTGFPASVVRPAAIYGPDNNIFDMELPMFLRLLGRRPILVPHGGLVVGSYGHVDDLCAAMVALVGKPEALGQVFNVSGESISVNRYIELLAGIVGAEPDVVRVADDLLAELPAIGHEKVFGHLFGVRHHAMLDMSKLRALGIADRFDLRTGHEDAYAWFRAQGYADLDGPLVDPVWGASWDFDAEAAFAARCAVHDPADAAMWRSVEATVRDVLLPSLADDWAKVAAIQLVGIVRYAATRPDDPTDDRAAELAALLDGLAANEVVAAHWPPPTRSAADVLAATSAVLAAAVTRHDTAGDEVRHVVRTVVRRQLDDELAVTEPMMPYFRGHLPAGAPDA